MFFVIPLALLSLSYFYKFIPKNSHKNENCSNFHQVDTQNSHEQGLSKNVFFIDELALIRRECCTRFWREQLQMFLVKKKQEKSCK